MLISEIWMFKTVFYKFVCKNYGFQQPETRDGYTKKPAVIEDSQGMAFLYSDGEKPVYFLNTLLK
ncbi:hypothetical protein J2W91_001606 [Paenibacillus amylolyticus]|uniref:Uncharacterized protein n=1 Tax=Paenibacillus amylolyticus TaxID=1451 RepID=A0AAP5LQ50_PAEAM|nr:hypothetical protein [Paenibacillus amylolyticus]